MGEAIHPQDQPFTSRSGQVTQRSAQVTHRTTPRGRGYAEDLDVALKPSYVKRVNRGEPDTQATNTPVSIVSSLP